MIIHQRAFAIDINGFSLVTIRCHFWLPFFENVLIGSFNDVINLYEIKYGRSVSVAGCRLPRLTRGWLNQSERDHMAEFYVTSSTWIWTTTTIAKQSLIPSRKRSILLPSLWNYLFKLGNNVVGHGTITVSFCPLHTQRFEKENCQPRQLIVVFRYRQSRPAASFVLPSNQWWRKNDCRCLNCFNWFLFLFLFVIFEKQKRPTDCGVPWKRSRPIIQRNEESPLPIGKDVAQTKDPPRRRSRRWLWLISTIPTGKRRSTTWLFVNEKNEKDVDEMFLHCDVRFAYSALDGVDVTDSQWLWLDHWKWN